MIEADSNILVNDNYNLYHIMIIKWTFNDSQKYNFFIIHPHFAYIFLFWESNTRIFQMHFIFIYGKRETMIIKRSISNIFLSFDSML